ncbi:MAG: alpha/beta hydrolase family protein [Christensenellales bacterium]
MTFVSDDGATLSARYIRPVGNKRVPTVLMFPRCGPPRSRLAPHDAFRRAGYAVFALENRAEADAQTQFTDAQVAARARSACPQP